MTCEPASGEAEGRGLLPSARPVITFIISLIQGITRRLLSPACKMNFKNFRDYLAWLYYQYLLITGIYVLEPWEKSIFNSVLFSAIAMVIYTSYVFVPIHVRLALEFFSQLFGGQPESAMALMN
ncbi:serine palmitoyltransferase small subunit B isoform X1 [Labrus mixtus]|uniref:serine palmitoyltransferase small subunit B isoform X1 n=2 Tax=Labrus mixtus TaxID=508554 RepID=UPI0029C08D55|nr:serine palmitoyltransferase small subunit B isoform X1 [Labrus mixtus]XP_060902793.1 serine palmitoyltransferase small subunit B isoform X1 [Labrus mixtus]